MAHIIRLNSYSYSLSSAQKYHIPHPLALVIEKQSFVLQEIVWEIKVEYNFDSAVKGL